MTGRMHEDELEIDVALVRRLLAAQHPQWADLPLERMRSAGTVNALFRLGDELVVRIPRIEWIPDTAVREARFLPKLAGRLPVHISVPVATGVPAFGYPWNWGVYPWLEGDHPIAGSTPQSESLAHDLARFVTTLHGLATDPDAPTSRGMSLLEFDDSVRAALTALDGIIDTQTATKVWDATLRTPAWGDTPVWVHGDLMPGNLLSQDGRLTGVIDWECFGVGDPAVDLMVAWNLLPTSARRTFRSEVNVDEHTWVRGRGWALWTGLVAIPYYGGTNPVLADNARYRVAEVLADHDVDQ